MGNKRAFKGIWIPKEIWLDSRLSAIDKIIYAEISSLDCDDGCYASNETLAEFCQCAVRTVSESIRRLKGLGLVIQVKFDGRTRWLRCVEPNCIAQPARQTSKICEAGTQNLQGSIPNTLNNNTPEYNNINNNINACARVKADCDFDDFWQQYKPVHTRDGCVAKGSRKVAHERYQRAIANGAKHQDIIAGLQRYLAYCESAGRFSCGAPVFLSQERWKDEYETINDNMGV